MSELFVRIFVFVGAAFVLGLAVGFVLWRAGRHSLSRREWVAARRELTRSQQALTRASERLRTLEEQADRLRTDLTKTNLRMAESDRQRMSAQDQAQASQLALGAAQDELAAAASQALYLRRRLTDLSILVSNPSTTGRAIVDVRLASEESVASTR